MEKSPNQLRGARSFLFDSFLHNIVEFCGSGLRFVTFSDKRLFIVMYFHCYSNAELSVLA